jgi:hypothetical protein
MIGVQGVIQPGNHAGGVTKCRMVGDFADSLSVDPDFSTVVETVQEFFPGVGKGGGCGHGDSPSLKSAAFTRDTF